jgi:mannose-1-phosphate guanylyltransferase
MAGGVGSRFWPVSRIDHPKQFLDILGTGQTLIQQTFRRFERLVPAENIFVVTSEQYVDLVELQLPAIPKENIIGEPQRKNTAPCVAYISFRLITQDPDASVIVAPSDHLILDEASFNATCQKALSFVHSNAALVTLGIQPTHANTGYGYIQKSAQEPAESVFRVKRFHEKPNLALAKEFVESGEFLWNAGIFIWNVKDILNAFEKHLPEMHALFDRYKDTFHTVAESISIEKIFSECEDISIDNGILEKSDNVYVIPSSFEWSDLGTWNSAWENMQKDQSANAMNSDNIMVIDATNCVVHAQAEKLIVLQGLENYIVVDTSDVLLICKKEKEQEIKTYVAEVKRTRGEQFLYSQSENTPVVENRI